MVKKIVVLHILISFLHYLMCEIIKSIRNNNLVYVILLDFMQLRLFKNL